MANYNALTLLSIPKVLIGAVEFTPLTIQGAQTIFLSKLLNVLRSMQFNAFKEDHKMLSTTLL